MNKDKLFKWILFFVLMLSINKMNAQTATSNQSLDARQQHIVSISALTAVGDLPHLQNQLNKGLDAGLTISEIKEILVQLYAYCGFPRSLNGINTFMTVLQERKAKGITDVVGKEAEVINDTTDTYERGRRVLEMLTKTPQAKPAPGFGAFAPRIDVFLKEHLFADIFESTVLTYQQRELVTIAALAAMTGVEAQLQAHFGMGMNTGITEQQLHQLIYIIEKNVGKKGADTGKQVLAKVIAARQK
ncbi:carboxymuconolactone decarboxylase family protein [Segetibacter sp.]|uniref:carboxymuconolactone decarboxylase family protein n=1 Tax=Segetibacter sp. TaxID=2231182 RepID=UPI00262744A4|nr:carboxymuconolactone decarboxylase family protein [Segetibacter sp.]MCW3081480.1 hypothetical protein [Segetibacter sp.]